MSHLAPFSYVDRGISAILMLLGIIMHILTSGGWAKINLLKPSNRNMKSTVVWFSILSMTGLIAYDFINIRIKYTEGYIKTRDGPVDDTFFVKPAPSSGYTSDSQSLLPIAGSLLNIVFTLKSSAHFLTLAFWSTTAKTTFGAETFGTSWEFKVYTIYSMLSVAIYPIVQYIFLDDSLLSIVVPQVVYHVECFWVVSLTSLINFRLARLIVNSNLSACLLHRMQYYIFMNRAQIVFVAMDCLSLSLINVDILTGTLVIAKSPFWTDVLTHMFSIGFLFALLIQLLIMLPLAILRLDMSLSTSRHLTLSKTANQSMFKFSTPQ